MKTICFYFQIHQPFRLKRYRFFDIGEDHYYYDDFTNEQIMQRVAANSFLPANQLLLELINAHKGKFRVAFSFSGVALDQLELYAPEVIESFQQLAKTGCVEFLAETYAHSLSSVMDEDEFRLQVRQQQKHIERLFGMKPKAFRNTELIYSDEIGEIIYSLGFKTVITDGAKAVLGWKSPNFVYQSATNPNLKLLLKNNKLSDDIAFRFSNYNWSEYPLVADKFIDWIVRTPDNEQVVNLFMNYETFGNLQPRESGIFDFLRALPAFAFKQGIEFLTPSEVTLKLKTVGPISIPNPISWADEENDLSSWMGNDLQREALTKLYSVAERVRLCKDHRLLQDWNYLQTSDHFFYMSTKQFTDGGLYKYFSPYDSPFEAFTNYMNVLSDFMERVEAQYPTSVDNEELNSLLTTIENQEKTIASLEKEVRQLRRSSARSEKPAPAKAPRKAAAPKKK
ncbi:MAG: glycoside hydrolase family 57 protein [Bacteroidales bacterium]|nr:glycoside hydrolase family 57 protein [Bacteroidales bacterium]